jgi:hypothetical protein
MQSLFEGIKSYIPDALLRNYEAAQNLPNGVMALMEMGNALAKLSTDSERVHQEIEREFRRKQLPYFRFNVSRDIGDIGLEEWNKATDLAAHTRNYMEEVETEEKRDLCVKLLLSRSSART